MNYYTTDELYHYGVKGMKWGVRRDVELLANHRRNVAVKNAKTKYKEGSITSDQKKAAIKKAKTDRKDYLKKTKESYEGLKTKEQREKASQNIRKQASKEVSSRTLKKGMRAVNDIVTTAQITSTAVSVGIGVMASPALAPMLGASLAGYTVGAMGGRELRKYIGSKFA